MEEGKHIYQYYPVVESKTHTRCSFCNCHFDYRTFKNGRIEFDGGTIYIKMCRNCFLMAKYNKVFCKKVYKEVKDYIGL